MRSKKTPPNEEDQEIAEEIVAASDETPTDVTAPETSAETEKLTAWDDVPASHGSAVPTVTNDDDDEDSIAAKLVYEGTDEADREQRLASADPDYEP
ncbi:MAG: hypothetical protein P4L99_07590 [Chthoniobacter sp.]|nr:hypothetical protein [Chthoniobacter sp.]